VRLHDGRADRHARPFAPAAIFSTSEKIEPSCCLLDTLSMRAWSGLTAGGLVATMRETHGLAPGEGTGELPIGREPVPRFKVGNRTGFGGIASNRLRATVSDGRWAEPDCGCRFVL
jgi:hypothetical protein